MHRRILGGGARDTRKNTPRIGDLVILKVVFHAERPRAKKFPNVKFKVQTLFEPPLFDESKEVGGRTRRGGKRGKK